MVSATQQSSRIRRRKATTNGKANKRERRANGTPVFPIHLDGHPSTKAAAEAKPASAKPAAAKPAAAKPAVKAAPAAKK